MFVERTEANHEKPKKVMCCEEYKIYSRDFSKTQVVERTVECGLCNKNVTLAPVTDTNLLLLIDNNPDCICPTQKAMNKRSIPDVCDDNLSQWRSDLSQQSCFSEDNSGNGNQSDDWKCFTKEK